MRWFFWLFGYKSLKKCKYFTKHSEFIYEDEEKVNLFSFCISRNWISASSSFSAFETKNSWSFLLSEVIAIIETWSLRSSLTLIDMFLLFLKAQVLIEVGSIWKPVSSQLITGSSVLFIFWIIELTCDLKISISNWIFSFEISTGLCLKWTTRKL